MKWGGDAYPFNYTGKVLVSIPDYLKLMKIEFARVRKLSIQSQWVINRTESGTIYADESIQKLKKCGEKTTTRLGTIGIKVVSDL